MFSGLAILALDNQPVCSTLGKAKKVKFCCFWCLLFGMFFTGSYWTNMRHAHKAIKLSTENILSKITVPAPVHFSVYCSQMLEHVDHVSGTPKENVWKRSELLQTQTEDDKICPILTTASPVQYRTCWKMFFGSFMLGQCIQGSYFYIYHCPEITKRCPIFE